jgi:hypothetical protein
MLVIFAAHLVPGFSFLSATSQINKMMPTFSEEVTDKTTGAQASIRKNLRRALSALS